MARTVQISFGDEEEKLYQEFIKQSEYPGKSKYVKQAIKEKIERDTNREIKILDDFLKQK
jgi:metal-responsive CopG/Arc/MetJ family transcriptional regulator